MFSLFALPLLVAAASGCAAPGGSGTATGDAIAHDTLGSDVPGDVTAPSDATAPSDGTAPSDLHTPDTSAADTAPGPDLVELDACSGDACAPPECVAGKTTCSDNGAGWEACGLDADGTLAYGRYVPCVPGRPCEGGRCANATCRTAEVMLVVDRSSSMLVGDTWDWFVTGINTVIRDYDGGNLFGMRQFPFGDACGVGEVIPLAPGQSGLANRLTRPEATAATPLAAALGGLEQAFGDPNDGEAIVLLTDGDETCGAPEDAIAAASEMFHRGVRVYVIAVTTTANQALLDQIAAYGGTGRSRLVTTQAELEDALGAVLEDDDACRECSAEPGMPGCDGNTWIHCGDDDDVRRDDCTAQGAICDPGYRECALAEGATCSADGELGCGSALLCYEGRCCERACDGKVCGDDGCGGTCGTCAHGDCVGGQCVCERNCQGRVCGDDGCGGSCGTCTQANYQCGASGQCVFDDPCGGITYEGCCGLLGESVTYCDSGVLKTIDCQGSTCGWGGASGYDCIGFPASDPAGQFPYSCP